MCEMRWDLWDHFPLYTTSLFIAKIRGMYLKLGYLTRKKKWRVGGQIFDNLKPPSLTIGASIFDKMDICPFVSFFKGRSMEVNV